MEKEKNMERFSDRDYEEAFNVFDKDGDKSITVTELGDIMRQLQMNPTNQKL